MGQAKRKELLRQAAQTETDSSAVTGAASAKTEAVITGVASTKTGVPPETEAVITGVASAMRRLAIAASGNFGGDCYTHTTLGQALLKDAGIESSLVIGFAAWRVGPNLDDIVSHIPMPGMPYQPGGIPYHAWLGIGGYIFDMTTYQLRQKCAHLDELDGGSTTVEWCPDYLLVPVDTVVSIDKVSWVQTPGLYFYEQHKEMQQFIIRTGHPVDPQDLEAARLLYRNQDMVAFGPNTL